MSEENKFKISIEGELDFKPYVKYEVPFITTGSTAKEDILKMSDEALTELEVKWAATEKENAEVYKHNSALMAQVKSELEQVLVKLGASIIKPGSWCKPKKYYSHFTKMLDEIKTKHRVSAYSPSKPSITSVEVKGKTYRVNFSPVKLTELVASVRRQVQAEVELEAKSNRMLQEAIKVALREGIDIEGLSNEEVVAKVNEEMEIRFVAETYPDGTEMYLKHGCYECSSWTVGERRCSCGNRRVYLTVEGNFLDGYYAYPECY